MTIRGCDLRQILEIITSFWTGDSHNRILYIIIYNIYNNIFINVYVSMMVILKPHFVQSNCVTW